MILKIVKLSFAKPANCYMELAVVMMFVVLTHIKQGITKYKM